MGKTGFDTLRAQVSNKADCLRTSPALAASVYLVGSCMVGAALLLSATRSVQAQTATNQPLSLQDAIAMAEQSNPEKAVIAAQEREARAGVQSAHAAMLPKLGASEAFTDSTDPVFAFGARLRQGRFTANDFSPSNLNYPPPTTDFTSALGASWTMFDSGRNFHQAHAAKSNLKAAEKQSEATKQDLAFQAIRAYYRALLADQEKLTTAEAVARAQSFSKEAHDRVKAGVALASEGLQADVELSQREQEAAEADSNASLAYADFGDALGQPSGNFALIKPTGTPQPMTSTLQALQANALQNRPDVAAARSRTAAASEAVHASHDAFGPSLSAFGNVQADNPHLTSGGNTNWTVGAKAEIQIFDGGARKAELSKSNAERQMAEAALRQAETQANLQVRQAFYAIQTAQRQYSISDQMLAEAQETLRTTLDRYGSGLATITEVMTQQDQLRSIELTRVESLYRWWTAEAQLRLATGEDILKDSGTTP
jgi:outer membrane protein TolC